MDIIHLLPDSVANQIAAGEVIQRPSSVIKELVENAIDAGAHNIDVFILDAGRTCIQVIDDGKGMSETDARLAFERHATSKIRQADDLFTLQTMGFRGEALPSIAAVAQVTLTTRTEDSELGTQICIEGSRVVSQQVVSSPVGANFEVKNLFFNIPARRKFLKSNQTEFNNITQEFERIALVNPSVAFSLHHNGTLITKLPASNIRQRVVNIFGKRLDEQLLPVDVDTTLAQISGFVGKPESSKKKGAHQYFFVNGRFMRHPYFHKAVQEAYDQLLPANEQVPYFLYFRVDPANIDVNISPTKTDIKFENEAALWQVLVAAIRESLGRFNAIPSIDFDVEGRPSDIPVFTDDGRKDLPESPIINVDLSYNPFSSSQPTFTRSSASAIGNTRSLRQKEWELLYQDGASSSDIILDEYPSVNPSDQSESLLAAQFSELEISNQHLQYKGQYILTAVRSGLMIVDQRRAHVRILYNRYKEQMKGKTCASQGLLFPELIQLSTADALLLSEMTDELSALGFDVTSLGGGSFSINGVPAGIDGLDPVALLQEMVDNVKEKGTGMEDELHHRIALTLARNASIVVGQVLQHEEMDALIRDLFSCDTPNYTPDGKPVIVVLEQENIEKLFK